MFPIEIVSFHGSSNPLIYLENIISPCNSYSLPQLSAQFLVCWEAVCKENRQCQHNQNTGSEPTADGWEVPGQPGIRGINNKRRASPWCHLSPKRRRPYLWWWKNCGDEAEHQSPEMILMWVCQPPDSGSLWIFSSQHLALAMWRMCIRNCFISEEGR